MLSRDGVIARYIFSFCFFFLSGSEMLVGWPATCSGVLGTIELATALMHYSPLMEIGCYLKERSRIRHTIPKT